MYIIDIGLNFKPCMYCHYYLSTCLPNDPASYFNAIFYACQSLRLQKSFKEYEFIPHYFSAIEDDKQKYLIINQLSAQSQS